MVWKEVSDYLLLRAGDTIVVKILTYLIKKQPKPPNLVESAKGTAVEFLKNNPNVAIRPAWEVIQRLRYVLSTPNVDKTITASVIAELVPHLNVTECAIIGKAILVHPAVKPLIYIILIIVSLQLFNNRFIIYRLFSERSYENLINNNQKQNMNQNSNVDLGRLAMLLSQYVINNKLGAIDINSQAGLSRRDSLIAKNANVNKAQTDLMNLINAFLNNNDNGGNNL